MNQKKAGVLLSYAQTVLSTMISLLYTPIMLRLLGQSEYGTYTIVNGFVSNLSLLSFGLGSAYMRFFTRAEEQDGEDGVARINGMFMTVFIAIGLLSLAVGFILVANVQNIFSAKLTAGEIETARLLMAMLVVNIAVSFPFSVFQSFITARERFFFQRIVNLITTVVNPIVMLPLLLAGYGSVSLVVVTLLLSMIDYICNVTYCIRKLHMKISFGYFDMGLLKQMAGFSFFIFLNSIIDQINWSVDTTILGIVSGTVSTAIYGVGAQFQRYFMTISTSISGVFTPQINRIVARNESDEHLTKLFTRVGRIQFMLLMLVLTGFIFVGKPFIVRWSGADYSDAYVIALLVMVPLTVPLIQNLGIEIQRAKNMHQFRSIVYFWMAIGNMVISIPLGMRYSGIGCALGTAISLIVGNGFVMNWYYQTHIGLDMKYFWKEILAICPSMLIPILLGILVTRFVSISGYSGVFLFAIPYAAIFTVSLYLLGMNESEKELLTGSIKKVIGKVRKNG